MVENTYLSHREQYLYNVILDTDIISTDEMKDLFPDLSTNMIHKIASSLNRKGYLYRLENGLYLVQKIPSDRPLIEDPFKIAQALYNGYIAFSSALRIYDLIEYEPFTIFIATPRRYGKTPIGNYLIHAISLGRRAEGVTWYKNYYVSNLEKTLFDCLYKPQHAGGYDIITKALYDSENIDWEHLQFYFEKFASPSLCQRSGYVLELVKETIGLQVPDEFLTYLDNRKRNKTRLFPTMSSRGKYSARWMLMDNIGQESILGWINGA